jgi:membrane protein
MQRRVEARTEAARGREAVKPAEIPGRGWLDILRRVKGQLERDRLSIIAAGVAFYALLAIFPSLLAVVAIYGLAADPAEIERQANGMRSMMPPKAADMLLGQLHGLIQTDRGALGFGAAVGVLLALWSASAGVRTLMEALNVAYDERERRGFLRFYSTALFLTLAGIVAVIVAIGIVVAVPIVLGFLGLSSVVDAIVRYARWPLVAAFVMFGLAVLYRYGPSRNQPRWAWVSWGAVIATALWLAGSAAFSLYVTRFGNYNETYGSAAAVVILLMWLLLSAYAVLIGAEVNAEMERQTRRDTTVGREKALGERGAYAADTVGQSR